jgi:hypothetical protein
VLHDQVDQQALRVLAEGHGPDIAVICFFITARFAEQNDRNSFIDAVLEQTSTLLGEPLAPSLSAATKEAHLMDSLARAAQQSGTARR